DFPLSVNKKGGKVKPHRPIPSSNSGRQVVAIPMERRRDVVLVVAAVTSLIGVVIVATEKDRPVIVEPAEVRTVTALKEVVIDVSDPVVFDETLIDERHRASRG